MDLPDLSWSLQQALRLITELGRTPTHPFPLWCFSGHRLPSPSRRGAALLPRARLIETLTWQAQAAQPPWRFIARILLSIVRVEARTLLSYSEIGSLIAYKPHCLLSINLGMVVYMGAYRLMPIKSSINALRQACGVPPNTHAHAHTTHTRRHTRAHTHTCAHTHTHTRAHAHTRSRAHTPTHVLTRPRMRSRTHAPRTHACSRAHTPTHALTRPHTCSRTHAHAHPMHQLAEPRLSSSAERSRGVGRIMQR